MTPRIFKYTWTKLTSGVAIQSTIPTLGKDSNLDLHSSFERVTLGAK
jgi:hypothetical protein